MRASGRNQHNTVRTLAGDLAHQIFQNGRGLLQTFQPRLRSNLADAGGNKRHIRGTTIVEVSRKDARTIRKYGGVPQITDVAFGAARVTAPQHDLRGHS
ncbi:MAG TPA: hypothetical protein VMB49_13225 [Acidobacteriaceae bacterium]|nr:hypothetical protein [Acidobacteriaceae bacterium]